MVLKNGLLGVDLGGTNVRVAMFAEDGKILCRIAKQHGDDKNPEAVFENVVGVIDDILNTGS